MACASCKCVKYPSREIDKSKVIIHNATKRGTGWKGSKRNGG